MGTERRLLQAGVRASSRRFACKELTEGVRTEGASSPNQEAETRRLSAYDDVLPSVAIGLSQVTRCRLVPPKEASPGRSTCTTHLQRPSTGAEDVGLRHYECQVASDPASGVSGHAGLEPGQHLDDADEEGPSSGPQSGIDETADPQHVEDGRGLGS